MELFETFRKKIGDIPIIAEDLGFLTPAVYEMLAASGYPGMKVVQFAFGDPSYESEYLPHTYPKNCVAYAGTHDNETLVQWYAGLDEESKAFALEYMNNAHTPIEEMHWDFIRLAMMSTANTCIIPVQDYMGLGAEARMNFPSTLGDNWKWRMSPEMLDKALIDRIYYMSKLSERLSEECAKAEEEALAAKLEAEKAAEEATEEVVETEELAE